MMRSTRNYIIAFEWPRLRELSRMPTNKRTRIRATFCIVFSLLQCVFLVLFNYNYRMCTVAVVVCLLLLLLLLLCAYVLYVQLFSILLYLNVMKQQHCNDRLACCLSLNMGNKNCLSIDRNEDNNECVFMAVAVF